MEIIIILLIMAIVSGIYWSLKYLFSSRFREEVKHKKIESKERRIAYIDKQYNEAVKAAPIGYKLCPTCSVRGVTRKEHERITYSAKDHVKCETCDDLYYVAISDTVQLVGKIEKMMKHAKISLGNQNPSFEKLIEKLIYLYGKERIEQLFSRIQGLYLLDIDTKHEFYKKSFEEFVSEYKLNTFQQETLSKKENKAKDRVKITGAFILSVLLYIGLIIVLTTVIFFIDNLQPGVKIAIGIPLGIAILIYTILYLTKQVSGFPGSSADKYHN